MFLVLLVLLLVKMTQDRARLWQRLHFRNDSLGLWYMCH